MHSLGSKASTSGLDSAHGYTGGQDNDEDIFYHYGLTQVVMGEALQEDIGVCSIM